MPKVVWYKLVHDSLMLGKVRVKDDADVDDLRHAVKAIQPNYLGNVDPAQLLVFAAGADPTEAEPLNPYDQIPPATTGEKPLIVKENQLQRKRRKETFDVTTLQPTPMSVFLPVKAVEPEFVCGDNYLAEVKAEIKTRLEEFDGADGAARVPPMAVVRCSRGGKTRTLYEIAYTMKEESPQTPDNHLAVLFITFNDFMPLSESENQDESMLQIFLKRVAFMATYKFEGKYSENAEDDIAMAFESFRQSNTFFDPIIFIEWFNTVHDILLIIDELSNLKGLDDGNREQDAKEFGSFLKENFLSRQGRYFVFSSHRISMLSDFGEFIQVSHGSYRGVVLWDLPLVPNLKTVTDNLYKTINGAREAIYFGLLPGLIYARSKRMKVAGNRVKLVENFWEENEDNLEEAFIKVCRSLVTGSAPDLSKSLQFLCDGCSVDLGENLIRWIPYHLQYILERFEHHTNKQIRLLSGTMAKLCEQLLDAKEKSGDGWECLFVLFLLARCIANKPDDLFLPGDWFGEAPVIEYNNYYSVDRHLDQCKTWNELKEGIKSTQSPSLLILYPTHSQFEAYDAFAVYSIHKKMEVYGYQLKEGKATSGQPVESSLRKSFVVRALPPKHPGWKRNGAYLLGRSSRRSLGRVVSTGRRRHGHSSCDGSA